MRGIFIFAIALAAGSALAQGRLSNRSSLLNRASFSGETMTMVPVRGSRSSFSDGKNSNMNTGFCFRKS